MLVGRVAATAEGRLRARLAADYRGLAFVRLPREAPAPVVTGPGGLIGPVRPPEAAALAAEAAR